MKKKPKSKNVTKIRTTEKSQLEDKEIEKQFKSVKLPKLTAVAPIKKQPK